MSGLIPSADWPSISTIWSPARIPALVGRRTDHGRDHSQPAALLVDTDLDADPAKLALDLAAKLPPLARVDVRRVRVEVLQHPLQGTLEQLAARYRADIIGLDLLDGVDEQAVELEHLIPGLGIQGGLPAQQTDGTDHRQGEDSSVAASPSTLLIRQDPNRLTDRSARTHVGPD